ncbi:hypothetical protein RJ639_047183 [Escallonia herrerae]|uniref:Uncharacterized protein n=1 Tax=Escallonia herrerae TaxID=1293975 RepID=A0AA88W8K8_9ASTE|nr:hypothetical protein RJ639_047183 [Escallonia herrerae]
MGRIFGGRSAWFRLSNTFRLVKSRPFCTPNDNNSSKSTIAISPNNTNSDKVDGSLTRYDAYRDVDKLDFMTAAKILFTTPPKTKKFGTLARVDTTSAKCKSPYSVKENSTLINLPLGVTNRSISIWYNSSLPACLHWIVFLVTAVYLVAQYARYEMKRMDAELELKKKAEEAEKAKEVELKAAEEKEAGSSPEILDVKVRLDKLEEVVKEYVVESKRQSGITSKENQERNNEENQPTSTSKENQERSNVKKQPTVTAPSETLRSESSVSAAAKHPDKQITSERTRSSGQQKSSGSALVADASQKDPKATQDGKPSRR